MKWSNKYIFNKKFNAKLLFFAIKFEKFQKKDVIIDN